MMLLYELMLWLLFLTMNYSLGSSNVNSTKTIFRKCCLTNERFHIVQNECIDLNSNSSLIPWLPRLLGVTDVEFHQIQTDSIEIETGPPSNCQLNEVNPFLIASRSQVEDLENYKFLISIEGHFLEKGKSSELLLPGNYCVDGALNSSVGNDVSKTQDLFIARRCATEPDNITLVHKCCPIGASIVIDHGNQSSCIQQHFNKSDNYNIQFYKLGFAGAYPVKIREDQYKIIEWSVKDSCRFGRFVIDPDESPDAPFYLLEDGRMYLPSTRSYLDPAKFCIERKYKSHTQILLACAADEKSNPWDFSGRDILLIIHPIGFIISDVFLVITILTYLLLPDLRHKKHGNILLCHMTSLFCAYLGLTVNQLGGATIGGYFKEFCKLLGIVTYSFLMAAFFWLNVMCFDMWRTFYDIHHHPGQHEMIHSSNKFICYSLYAWGCTLVFTMVVIIMDFTPGLNPFLIKPNFGYNSCWFSGLNSMFAYFLAPVAIILLLNLIFFISTLTNIITFNKKTNRQLVGQNEQHKERLWLYLKLFVVMGLSWIMEIISWTTAGVLPGYLWHISDLFNSLQGLFIFLIFVFQKKTLDKLGITLRDNYFRHIRRKFERDVPTSHDKEINTDKTNDDSKNSGHNSNRTSATMVSQEESNQVTENKV